MDIELKESVELETRRILAAEASAYRDYLEKQYNHLKIAVVVLATIAGGIFAALFGKTWFEIDKSVKNLVNEITVSTKIEQKVKIGLDQKIDDSIKEKNQEIEKQIESAIGGDFSKKVQAELNKVDIKELINNYEKLPVGLIISSMLSPEEFNRNLIGSYGKIWVLADGRGISGSEYENLTGKKTVPDLRGVFLRGLNEGRTDGRKDPDGEGRKVGDFQSDSIMKHVHKQNPKTWSARGSGSVHYHSGKANNIGERHRFYTEQNEDGTEETRPKNIAVYFYIKIN